MNIIIIGAGAAGFFCALVAKRLNPRANVTLLERSSKLLSKVRISGGGRCNVTHACFEPKLLVQNYPRGHKELLGPFHEFQPLDTIEWFKDRGVNLKKESDGRMFPTTDSSQTIIDCFIKEANTLGVKIETQTKLKGILKKHEGFELDIGENPPLFADRVVLATGSSKIGWEIANNFGHTIQTPVPSLFTFNIPSFSLIDLAGVSVKNATLTLRGFPLEQIGPLLITHWGFSGPAALKLSAFAARYLAEQKYEATLCIDWLPDVSEGIFYEQIKSMNGVKLLGSLKILSIPKSLWSRLCTKSGLSSKRSINSLSKASILQLFKALKNDKYEVVGKTTNKEEFVTCGGITLSEVNFKRMESKYCKGLFFCGEILDIDGVTGGFNFQNAWTTGWLAGSALGENQRPL